MTRWLALAIAAAAACSSGNGELPAPDAAATIDGGVAGGAGGAPVAIVGPDREVATGERVVLDAALSGASAGAAYRWRLSSAPAGSAAAIAEPTAARTSVRPDLPGSYLVELVVTDGGRSSAPATLSIRAERPSPRAFIVAPPRVRVGTVVSLDGSGSRGDGLTYAWSVSSAGPVPIDGADRAMASFTASRVGTHIVDLRVRDAYGQEDIAQQYVNAENAEPHAEIAAQRHAVTGQPLLLDARASSDADGHPLRAMWSVTHAPTSSTAAVRATGDLTAELVPDRDGLYVVELRVTDGIAVSFAAATSIVAARARWELDYLVVAAAASPATDRLLLVSPAPNLLHFLDPVTGTDEAVPLPLPVADIAITPDGRTAVLGHAGWFSIVDLVTQRVIATRPARALVARLQTAGDGWAYFLLGEDLYALRLADGALTRLDSHIFVEDMVYVAGRLYAWERYGYHVGAYAVAGDAVTPLGWSERCKPLWAAPDGQRFADFCGEILGPDLAPIGSLPIDFVDFVAFGGAHVWALASEYGDDRVRVFDAATFAPLNRIAMPFIDRESLFGTSVVHGNARWLIPLGGGDRAAVVYDNGAIIGNDVPAFGVAVVQP